MARVARWGVLVPIALGLAGGCPGPAARPPDSIQERPDLDRLLRDLVHHPTATVTIQQGTEHVRDGVVTLIVRGDGNATVEQLRSGVTHRFTKALAADRLAAVGGALADHHLTRARTSTLPRPSIDSPVVLRLDPERGAPFRADLWSTDRGQDRDLDAILELADALVHEVTAGALGRPARAP